MRVANILVVDDEPDVRGVLTDYLSAVGHTVTGMASGREALEHLGGAHTPYDIALIDWNLPGISGRDVVHGVRQLCPGTSVLVTTGQLDITTSSTSSGAEVVHKPFSLADLNRRIQRLLPA